MIGSAASLLVLAGGESSRMGMPKHLMPVSGKTAIDYILEGLGPMFGHRMIAARDFEVDRPGLVRIGDTGPVRCPLAGILPGLLASPFDSVFVIACDMPYASADLVRLLVERSSSGADVTVPVVRGFFEPLLAVYRRSAAPAISSCLERGRAKTTGFYGSVRVETVLEQEVRAVDPTLRSFVNLNTPRDYQEHCPSS